MTNTATNQPTHDEMRSYWAARAEEERIYVAQFEKDFGKHPEHRELADHEGW